MRTMAIVVAGLLAMACGTDGTGSGCDQSTPPAAVDGAACAPSTRHCDGWTPDLGGHRVCWFDCAGEPTASSGCDPDGYCLTGDDGVKHCTFICPLVACE